MRALTEFPPASAPVRQIPRAQSCVAAWSHLFFVEMPPPSPAPFELAIRSCLKDVIDTADKDISRITYMLL